MGRKQIEELLIRVNLSGDDQINDDLRWDIIDTLNNHLKELEKHGN